MKIRVMLDTENPGDFCGYDEAGDEVDLIYLFAKRARGRPEVAIRWRPAIEAGVGELNGRARFHGLDQAVATHGARFDL